MDGLDPCIGIGFLIKNSDDLRQFEDAFDAKKDGMLKSIACIYKERPKQSDAAGMGMGLSMNSSCSASGAACLTS